MKKGAKVGELYEKIGGMETCRRLSERFHQRVGAVPALSLLFPKNLAPSTERLALFLAESLGGPAEYTARRGKTSLLCRHDHVPIGTEELNAWLREMFTSMDEVGIPEPAKSVLHSYFAETAPTLSDPWIQLYNIPLGELEALLDVSPSRAVNLDQTSTLLARAAGCWDEPRVAMLLKHVAETGARDKLGHDALYRAANAKAPGRESDGRAVVELLIQHGANVNGRSGPGNLTPLHAAARRGTVEIGQVLLDAGAEIEAKDSKGETPLRRAVNCRQKSFVRLLLSRGADPLNPDNKGLTPLAAARDETIRAALTSIPS